MTTVIWTSSISKWVLFKACNLNQLHISKPQGVASTHISSWMEVHLKPAFHKIMKQVRYMQSWKQLIMNHDSWYGPKNKASLFLWCQNIAAKFQAYLESKRTYNLILPHVFLFFIFHMCVSVYLIKGSEKVDRNV